jgi:hypothetical protein
MARVALLVVLFCVAALCMDMVRAAGDYSTCMCPGGCVNGESPVDKTFYVHCATKDKACKDDTECAQYCKNCCLKYGYQELDGIAQCDNNLAECYTPIPLDCQDI